MILKLAFIQKSKWGKVKMLYLLCRYLPFVLLATDTYREPQFVLLFARLKMP
jgi:hypothetical protein